MLTLQLEQSSDQLTALKSFMTLTENPADFTAIYDIDALLRKTPLSTLSVHYLKQQPGMQELMEERYLAPIPDLDKLLTCPPNSVGYLYAASIKEHGFDPVFYRQIAVQDDATYIALRRSQTHDIHHIITGFGTDLPSELGLQAFELAQMRSPLAITLVTSGLVNALLNPAALERTMALIIQGWQMGLQAKPLMAQKWEDHWEKSVTQWRTELNVDPIVET